MSQEIETIVANFTHNIVTAITEIAHAKVRSRVLDHFDSSGMGTPVRLKPPKPPAMGRPTKSFMKSNGAPVQLCPVPKCQGRAAPVFGMVCAKHKDVAKSKIKKYREARRAAAS